MLILIQTQRSDQIRWLVRPVKVAASIIESNNLLKRGELAVVEEGSSLCHISQARNTERSNILIIAGYLESSGVVVLWSNADVSKRIISEQRSGVTDITARRVKHSATAIRRRIKWLNARYVKIKCCSVRVKNSLIGSDRHNYTRRRYVSCTKSLLEQLLVGSATEPRR